MTTTAPSGDTAKFTRREKLVLLVLLAAYAWAVYALIGHVGEPLNIVAGITGPLTLAALPFLPVVRQLPGIVYCVAYVLVVEMFVPDAFAASMWVGCLATIVVSTPILFGWFVVRAWKELGQVTIDRLDSVGGRIMVGLSGYGGAGKDTAAKGLLENGFTRVSFADKIRAFCYAQNPIVINEDGGYERVADVVDRLGWQEAKMRCLDVRRLLQRTGTDAGRKVIGDNVWIDATMNDLPDSHLVFTDLRFPNEYDAVRGAGGLAVRIERPGTTSVNRHESETSLDNHFFDANIWNDGPPEAAAETLVKYVEQARGPLA